MYQGATKKPLRADKVENCSKPKLQSSEHWISTTQDFDTFSARHDQENTLCFEAGARTLQAIQSRRRVEEIALLFGLPLTTRTMNVNFSLLLHIKQDKKHNKIPPEHIKHIDLIELIFFQYS